MESNDEEDELKELIEPSLGCVRVVNKKLTHSVLCFGVFDKKARSIMNDAFRSLFRFSGHSLFVFWIGLCHLFLHSFLMTQLGLLRIPFVVLAIDTMGVDTHKNTGNKLIILSIPFDPHRILKKGWIARARVVDGTGISPTQSKGCCILKSAFFHSSREPFSGHYSPAAFSTLSKSVFHIMISLNIESFLGCETQSG